MNRSWAPGFEPQFQRMNERGVEIFINATFAEMNGGKGIDVEGLNKLFLTQILNTRIEAMKLPIHFTDAAKLAMYAFCDRPGSVVALLIDCLNAFPEETITVEKLTSLYPFGFYTEESICDYIDNYLKTRKIKWAEVY